jgi:WD40 repeat protein
MAGLHLEAHETAIGELKARHGCSSKSSSPHQEIQVLIWDASARRYRMQKKAMNGGLDEEREKVQLVKDYSESKELLVEIIERDPKLPDIPAIIVGSVIAPFVRDRRTFNNITYTCKEVKDMLCEAVIPPPWPERRLYAGHPLWSVAFSPDGMLLAAGGGDGKIRLWNKKAGPMESLRGHLGRVYSVAFSPNGKYMASGSGDGDIRIWNLQDYTSVTLDQNTPHVDCLSFSRDGELLASGGDGTIRLWDVESAGCVLILQEEDRVVESLAFSPDGRTLASGTWGNVIRLWDLSTAQCVSTFHESTCVHSIVFSPDGKYIASGSDNKDVRLWNILDQDYSTLKGHTDSVWSVAFSPSGQHLASGSDDGTVRIWSVSSGKCTAVLDGHGEHSVYSVTFSPDEKLVASASSDGFVELCHFDCCSTPRNNDDESAAQTRLGNAATATATTV